MKACRVHEHTPTIEQAIENMNASGTFRHLATDDCVPAMTTLLGIERWLTSQPKTASASGLPDESWDLRTLACTEGLTSAHLAIAN